ncbi:MAG: hypothetical protein LBJ22_02720, partial [Synergistaceae bacterium]|nr:hypothetical protein [Synergistaceae bacterium]
MKLSEVLDVLLKAEDEALEMRSSAEQEAKAVIQKAHDKFARDQEARLNAAREEARAAHRKKISGPRDDLFRLRRESEEQAKRTADRTAEITQKLSDMTQKV